MAPRPSRRNVSAIAGRIVLMREAQRALCSACSGGQRSLRREDRARLPRVDERVHPRPLGQVGPARVFFATRERAALRRAPGAREISTAATHALRMTRAEREREACTERVTHERDRLGAELLFDLSCEQIGGLVEVARDGCRDEAVAEQGRCEDRRMVDLCAQGVEAGAAAQHAVQKDERPHDRSSSAAAMSCGSAASSRAALAGSTTRCSSVAPARACASRTSGAIALAASARA